MSADFDPHSPMFGDISFAQVLEITGRSRRQVKRWIARGLITPFGRGRAVKFNEDQVVEVETRMAAAARANHDRIRARGGRPGPRKPPTGDSA